MEELLFQTACKKANTVALCLALLAFSLIVGCGTDVSFEMENLPESVAGVDKVPDCTSAYEGEEIFVEDISKKLRCEDGLWEDVTKEPSKKTSSSSKKSDKNSSSSNTKSSKSSSSNSGSSKSSSSTGSSQGPSCDKCYVDGDILEDKRDETKYKTVIINGRRWMAENLRYVPDDLQDSVRCYMDSAKFCDKYGPMYPYSATGLPSSVDVGRVFNQHPFPFKWSVCPEGWNVPNGEDWDALFEYAQEVEALDSTTKLHWRNLSLMDTSWHYIINEKEEYRGNNALGFSILDESKLETSWEESLTYAWPVFWIALRGPSNFGKASNMKSYMTLEISSWGWVEYKTEDENKRAFIRCVENIPEEPPEIVFDSIVDQRYGDKYKVVKIGSQWWMAENLRFRENPDLCHPYSDNKYIKDECHYPVFIPEGYSEDICPEGWLIPTMGDWYNLLYYVATHNGDEPLLASLIDTAYWDFVPDSLKRSNYNFGMNIRATGAYEYHPYRGRDDPYLVGTETSFRTRTGVSKRDGLFSGGTSITLDIYNTSSGNSISLGSTFQRTYDEMGFSVRCIKEGTGEE